MKAKLNPRSIFLSSVALLLITAFTSCSKKAEVTGTSYIQVTNASQAASPIDFYVDNTKKNNTALAYNQSSGYISVTSTDHPALIKTSASGVTAATFNISPQPNVYYSIFYFGANTAAYQDDMTAPQSGKARIRFINLNLGVTTNVDLGISGGAIIASNLIAALASDYLEVAPGSTFSLYASGSSTVLLSIPTSIQAGHIYTMYVSGVTQADLVATVLLQK
jgi:phosphomevalonate kinase